MSPSPLIPAHVTDVWRSTTSGVSWSLILSAAPWEAREGAGGVSTSSSNAVIISGYNQAKNIYLQDVWGSIDLGLTWSLTTSKAPFSGRTQFGTFFRSGSILVIGGINLNDVYQSSNSGGKQHSSLKNLPLIHRMFLTLSRGPGSLMVPRTFSSSMGKGAFSHTAPSLFLATFSHILSCTVTDGLPSVCYAPFFGDCQHRVIYPGHVVECGRRR